MKKLMVLALLAAAGGSAVAQVGVSIGINQPGVYGRINIGEAPPPPALVRARPVYVAPLRPGIAPPPPQYLYVPVAEQRDWRRYCRRYEACGQPVYFVREDWVRERYVREHPDWGRRHGWGPDRRREGGYGPGRDDDRGPGRHGDRGRGHDGGGHGPGRDDDRGPGRDDGRGHDRR